MPAPEPAGNGQGPDQPASSGGGSGRRNALIAALVVFVLVVAGVAYALLRDDDSDSATTDTVATTTTGLGDDTTTSTTALSTTTTSAATTTTLPDTPPDTSTAVWPWASSGTRYTDPVAAATGFAVEFVGFVDPVVGDFKAGDTHSGEVDVQPNPTGPVTTVLVAQLSGSDTWWVLGSATDNIQIAQPSDLASITSPVEVQGSSTAFESTVNVEVREDGNRTAIGESTVMGGANGEMAPFDGTVDFSEPSASNGAVVLFTLSADTGRVAEASVVRVAF
jgi:hypothetical protein